MSYAVDFFPSPGTPGNMQTWQKMHKQVLHCQVLSHMLVSQALAFLLYSFLLWGMAPGVMGTDPYNVSGLSYLLVSYLLSRNSQDEWMSVELTMKWKLERVPTMDINGVFSCLSQKHRLHLIFDLCFWF